ncbi:uncharacterized protein LOC121878672 [Homarus americanus]|uniref:uncharacterized protein LOC121878672 n=1 Tax=Homarus americanus TaxID=6706 RepID=UPI001C476105|nr:uncharacterized protein LOC121878672 [Homarus americanus]XP_042240928.1 uncharacterized protein LOC121878672 [Homarus americanus]XP_042240929.1 uncharacterized protein LOC121878672 [Homarus americanus]XP_042240930.1 uncharacterized protein LOC121878672 [Homarus americanus]
MPGRGRDVGTNQGETLRRPGQTTDGGDAGETNTPNKLKDLLYRILDIKSPDDLQVQEVASEVKATVTEEEDLKWFVEELCTHAYKDRVFTPVAAKLFGLIAQHHAGDIKIRDLLMRRVQDEYDKRLDLLNKDRYRFVTSALFLGEVYHQVKIGKSPFRVLVGPVLKYLDMIIEPHLAGDSNENVDDDMIVVSKQLLQSGVDLHESKADAVEALVLKVTEVFCRCQLTAATRLNLVAALADLWPLLAKGNISLRTQHASLAAKLGVSLHI